MISLRLECMHHTHTHHTHMHTSHAHHITPHMHHTTPHMHHTYMHTSHHTCITHTHTTSITHTHTHTGVLLAHCSVHWRGSPVTWLWRTTHWQWTTSACRHERGYPNTPRHMNWCDPPPPQPRRTRRDTHIDSLIPRLVNGSLGTRLTVARTLLTNVLHDHTNREHAGINYIWHCNMWTVLGHCMNAVQFVILWDQQDKYGRQRYLELPILKMTSTVKTSWQPWTNVHRKIVKFLRSYVSTK